MESPIPIPHNNHSPVLSPLNGPSSHSSTTTTTTSQHKPTRRLMDDPNTLTSFNPFADEDEQEESSYNLLSSFLSKMKNSMSAPLSSVTSAAPSTSTAPAAPYHASTAPSVAGSGGQGPGSSGPTHALETRRPSLPTTSTSTSTISGKTNTDRPHSLFAAPSQVAPPLVSRAELELPTFSMEYGQQTPPRPGSVSSTPFEYTETGLHGGPAIPGFPIQDDTRSIKTSTSFNRSKAVSKVMRRIRGEGLSRDYWMDDENAKECFSCRSVFKAWRRKHHCRICGQIFCGRCASTLIDGVRFGHNGMIRVCVLCLNDDAKNDDDDDRRSVVSSVTGAFPIHQFGQFPADAITPNRFSPSPFHAYSRSTDDPFNVISIAEAKRQMYYLGQGSEGTETPYFVDTPDGAHWEASHENPAPFRRAMSDDDGDPPPGLPSSLLNTDGPPASASSNKVDIPARQPLNVNVSFNSVPFPGAVGSPAQETPRPESRNTFSRPFYGDYEPSTPFIRSRVQSRLDSVMMGEPGWRTRKESVRYAQLLNGASQKHLRTMLEQMLKTEGIKNIKEWEEVLVRLAMRIAKEMTFTSLPHRQGQDMDVRRYVKIKKIPGGRPKDSEYVDGAVITKNVAHKQMSRLLHNPRVMLVTFPLEFHRVEGQYMHFPQIVRQEKEYLTNLASRIAALRPHVVLVEKSVSGIALDALAKNNIAVARSVKPTAVQTVARMTQADVFSSMDKLALEPRLGHCRKFRIQTFDHHLIPGRRKTYMRFEGCAPDMGCTIILRGGDMETLRKIKKVTRFLTFIVRNLKLETHLHVDTFVSLSSTNPDPIPSATHSRHVSSFSTSTLTPSMSTFSGLNTALDSAHGTPPARFASLDPEEDDGEQDGEKKEETSQASQISARIAEALEPYQKTFISVSATLRFPPPYPILRMKELDDELTTARRVAAAAAAKAAAAAAEKEKEEAAAAAAAAAVVVVSPSPPAATNVHELEQQQQQQDALEQEDISAQIEALPSTLMPTTPGGTLDVSTPYLSPAAMTETDSYFSPMSPAMNFPNHNMFNTSFSRAIADRADSQPDEPEPLKFVEVEDLDATGALNAMEWKHQEYQRYWEWYLRKNKDDFVVEKYQYIYLREYTVPLVGLDTSRPCFAPTLQHILFYGENDLSLGQFIDKAVTESLVQFLDPKAICQGKACDTGLADHAKVFVHNSTKVSVSVERTDPQPPKPRHMHYSPYVVYTFSRCRECAIETLRVEVSEEVLRYSFAKFLEAYFYPPADEMVPTAPGCPHNLYQHHFRYFAFKGMRIKVQADPIVLKELIFPPTKIYVRRETQLEIKNRDFRQLLQRNDRWYQSLIGDLTQYAMETSTGEDQELDQRTLTEINNRITMAEIERKSVKRFIHQIYQSTRPTDTLAIIKVFAHRQEKIVKWQQDFDALQAQRSDKGEFQRKRDRKSKPSAFGSVRAMWKYDLTGKLYDPSTFSSNVSEAEDGARTVRRTTADSFTSSASDVSETESAPDSALSTSGEIEKKEEGGEKETTPGPEDREKVEEGKEGNGGEEVKAPTVDAPVTESPVDLVQAPPEGQMLAIPSIEISEDDGKPAEDKPTSDPDSDSTIEAVPLDSKSNIQLAKALQKKKEEATLEPVARPSRLPRRSTQPTVADLVRKYSDYLPAQGVQELTKTALAPMSESEQDSEYPTFIPRRSATRTRSKQIARKASTSDFEQGYAANVVPRLLSRPRKPWGSSALANGGGNDSQPASRMHSPEKRGSYSKLKAKEGAVPSRPSSPTRRSSSQRPSKIRVPSQNTKELKFNLGRPPSSASKNSFRKTPTAGRVSNITKQFERISKDAERSKTKYTVLRGKRARPVASARANIEILSSIKDAIRDESESSDSSSEADDEADVEEEAPRKFTSEDSPPRPKPKELPLPTEPETPSTATTVTTPDVATTTDEGESVPSSASTIVGCEAGQDVTVPPAQGAPALPTSPLSENVTTPRSEMSDTESQGNRLSNALSDTESTGPRMSIFNAISGWLPAPVVPDDPFGDSEIIFDSEMVVRLDEPTSIIALALNSKKYRELLQQSKQERLAAAHASLSEGSEAFMPDDRSVSDSTSTWGVVTTGEAQDGASSIGDPNFYSSTPWLLTFPSTGLEISCTVLYPEQFDAIRRLFDCETSIIESLARCVKWKATGGKSGSAFLKTQDDRFIAKELSRSELQTMETFTPQYYKYVQACFDAERPTLLAKIFGCYKVTYKRTGMQERGSGKSKTTQMNLLIMENLFYDRRFKRIYDLKGSTRNRHIKSTGKQNEVLLDENLVEASHTNPFYLREHSKRILRGALYNDSKFLADLNVMDYSLVCGVDEKNNELVLGIVDYIRTYTWDKKLETWVKESAFLGAGKGEPTIVTPKQYRQRFLSAMERYFPLVPDRWMKIKDTPEEDAACLAELWPDW